MAVAAVRDGRHLLEREEVLGSLHESLAEARRGYGRLVLVVGEAGAGKSAAVRAFCDGARGSAHVLWGGCDPLFTPRPLGPFLDIAEEEGGELQAVVEKGPPEVAAALLRTARSTSATIVVVEDVHWADEGTLDVLRLLGRKLGQAPLLVVATFRDAELDRTHPLRIVLGELATQPHVDRLPVPPLTAEAVAELAAEAEVDAAELHRLTGGNPFFVTEVLASGTVAIPPTVRDAVLARAARLSGEARAVLDAVAIAPPQVEVWLLEVLAGADLTGLEECLSSGMLIEAANDVAFRHELARLAIEESLEPGRRLSLHRAALAALAAQPADPPDAARIAHHAEAAGDGETVVRFAPAAAERASALGAHREAAAQYARALRYGDRLSPGERGDLLRKQAVEYVVTDQYDESLAAATQAIEEYHAIGDRLGEGDALRIRSDFGWCPGYIADCTRDAREAVTLLETVPASRELSHAYANLGSLHKDAEERQEAKAWAARAIELGQKVGAHDAVIRSTTDIGVGEVLDGVPAGLARLEDALASARKAGLGYQVARVYLNMLGPAAATRNFTITDRHLTPGLQYCSDQGFELHRLYLLADAARVALDTGRWDEAAEHAKAVLRVPRCSTTPRILTLVVLALVRARRGDPEVRPLLEEAWALAEPTGELPRIGPVAVARAEVAWLDGRPDDVIQATDAALDLAVRRESTWRVGELVSWRRRAGVPDAVAIEPRGPFAAQIAGNWAVAAEQWRELGCPYEAALAFADADKEQPLRRALDEMQQLGARPAAAIVARRLQERGVRNVPRGPRPSTRGNRAQLTARELDVLRLLADGLRNGAIAERLFVSPRTVEHHVSAILAKLGVQSRGEAVAEGRRLGLVQDT
jgi:DNA-binding CsgD family transcriptional regulator/tetratricopeptide (TPR) repeat protein